MPELLGKWFPKMPEMSPVISNDVPTMVNIPQDNSPLKDVWCYRKQPEDDKPMISCDYPNCRIQWFYLGCLKLNRTKIPKGNW